MSDPKSPVSSFGDELQKALRLGCKQEVILNFPSEKLASRFRQRIMALRRAMRTEKHPEWQEAYRCGVFLEGARVTLAPRDSEFAGVIGALPPAPPLPEAPSLVEGAPEPSDPADAFLASLHKKAP